MCGIREHINFFYIGIPYIPIFIIVDVTNKNNNNY